MSATDTVIVGAGPYGLSIAAHMRAAGKPFKIIGQPMESWKRHMPRGMYLKSEPSASSLSDPKGRLTYEKFAKETGRPYQSVGRPAPLDEFLEYANWFQQRAVPEVLDLRLVELTQDARAFRLLLSDGSEWSARRVVLATGHVPYRHIPEALKDVPAPLVVHTCDVSEPADFAGRRVTVVGAGQSSLETAALLAEAGANVRVLIREPVAEFNDPPNLNPSLLEKALKPRSGLSAGWRSLFYAEAPHAFRRMPLTLRRKIAAESFGPAGSWWLRARIDGKIPVLTDHTIVSAQARGGGVRLQLRAPAGPIEMDADVVIAGTGYVPGLDRLPYLSDSLRSGIETANGLPLLDDDYQCSAPGLHFVGAASAQTFGPVMRFMYGAKHPAATLARVA